MRINCVVLQSEYWKVIAPYLTGDETNEFAIEKLLQFRFIESAISFITKHLQRKGKISSDLAIRALLAALNTDRPLHPALGNDILGIIGYLQQDSETDAEKLLSVELSYLPLLNGNTQVRPIAVECKLAADPEFFCEVIQSTYGKASEIHSPHESASASLNAAIDAQRQLLHEWRITPGTEKNGRFNPEKFEKWLKKVKEICSKSGHFAVALNIIGSVLVHAPADSDGLWINRSIANALNGRDIGDMRGGYRHGMLNGRNSGAGSSNGKGNGHSSSDFLDKADSIEKEGYKRFASTLREIASVHDHRTESNAFWNTMTAS